MNPPRNINHRTFVMKTLDLESTISYCMNLGLLASHNECSCGSDMYLISHPSTMDRKIWRCRNNNCRKRKSIRYGSFFSSINFIILFLESHCSLAQIMDIIYFWVHKGASVIDLKREIKISSEAITNWRSYCREICGQYFINNPIVLGGVGHTVEIDESAFVRRKHNVGRTVSTQWVFGGIDLQNRNCFLIPVAQRNADTLLPIIQDYILPGTTIISDLWGAYNSLRHRGYQHLTVNHSINFVDPITGATTNHIEALWNSAKRRNKKEAGTSRSLLKSYLIEFMYRYHFRGTDLLTQFIKDINSVYRV